MYCCLWQSDNWYIIVCGDPINGVVFDDWFPACNFDYYIIHSLCRNYTSLYCSTNLLVILRLLDILWGISTSKKIRLLFCSIDWSLTHTHRFQKTENVYNNNYIYLVICTFHSSHSWLLAAMHACYFKHHHWINLTCSSTHSNYWIVAAHARCLSIINSAFNRNFKTCLIVAIEFTK